MFVCVLCVGCSCLISLPVCVRLSVIHRFKGPTTCIRCLATSQDEQHLFVGEQNGNIIIFALNADFIREQTLQKLSRLGFWVCVCSFFVCTCVCVVMCFGVLFLKFLIILSFCFVGQWLLHSCLVAMFAPHVCLCACIWFLDCFKHKQLVPQNPSSCIYIIWIITLSCHRHSASCTVFIQPFIGSRQILSCSYYYDFDPLNYWVLIVTTFLIYFRNFYMKRALITCRTNLKSNF